MGLLQHLLHPGHAAAAIAARASPSSVKGDLEEYWDYTHRILEWGDGGSPNMILDDGGDATGLVMLGSKAEQDITVLDNPGNEEETFLFFIRRSWPGSQLLFAHQGPDPGRDRPHRCGRLYKMQKSGELPFPAINVNDSVKESSTPSTAAVSRWWTASSAPPT